MDNINYRLISSSLFLTNIYYCYYKNYYIYALLFGNLLISSVILHWVYFDFNYMKYEIDILKKIDQINVLLIILYGAYVYFKKLFTKKNNFILSSLVIYFVCLCIFLWNYGYEKKRYCFDKDQTTAAIYHSFMHICSVLGHLLIVFL